MRILYARNLYRPVDFGGNRYPLEVTTRLAKRGHEVTVVTGRFGETVDVPGVRVVQYPVSRRSPLLTFSTNALFARIAIARSTRGWRPDVVVHSSYDVAYGCHVIPIAGVPSTFIYHSSFHSEAVRRLASGGPLKRAIHAGLSRFVGHVERAVLRSAERVIAVSPFSADQIAARDADAGRRTVVIPTGVDTDRFSPGNRTVARARLGIPADAFVLVTVGRLTPVKRYDRAIRAVAGLGARGLSAILLVVGEGPERGRLAELANELGVTSSVRFEGFQDGPDVVERLRAADLQLCTSDFENWSLALLEGLACGLPVLGTPFGGIPQLLSPVDPSLVLTDGEPETIARAIERLARDRARLDELGRRARSYANGFAWDSVVDSLEKVFEEVSAKR